MIEHSVFKEAYATAMGLFPGRKSRSVAQKTLSRAKNSRFCCGKTEQILTPGICIRCNRCDCKATKYRSFAAAGCNSFFFVRGFLRKRTGFAVVIGTIPPSTCVPRTAIMRRTLIPIGITITVGVGPAASRPPRGNKKLFSPEGVPFLVERVNHNVMQFWFIQLEGF